MTTKIGVAHYVCVKLHFDPIGGFCSPTYAKLPIKCSLD